MLLIDDIKYTHDDWQNHTNKNNTHFDIFSIIDPNLLWIFVIWLETREGALLKVCLGEGLLKFISGSYEVQGYAMTGLNNCL